MTISQLINEILTEWAYRVNDGMPNPKNPTHLKELGVVLSEMGLSHIKTDLVENLLTEKGKTPEPVVEEEGTFKNPVLNKSIKYKNTKGEDVEGIVGNLLRLPKEHPGRKAAEALLPPEGSDERDALNKDLGGQNQPTKPGEDKAGKGDEEGGQQEDPIKKAAAMFDPKVDPAMAARLSKEKEVQAQLAKDAEKDKEAEKPKEEPKKDDGFNPIPAADVQSEIPEADPDTFGGESDIPDGIDKKDLEKFNTDISKVKQIVDDAKAKGEKAPNINLCQITVPGTNLYCDDNLGIPREEMPQFKGKPQPGTPAADMPVDKNGEVDTEPLFKKMLEEKGITVTQTEVPADKLKATQSELVGAKVVGMMGALEENPEHPSITAPIYVSRDGFVIDGHHRWAAIAAYNAAHPDAQIPMKVQVIDMDIKDAIPMCNKFAEEQGVAAKKADANKETPTEQPSEPAKREPANDDPESKAQQFKGKSSGENIQTMEMEGGGFVYGTKHGNTAMVDDILDDVKSKIPKERWGDIVFVGEGGATNDAGEVEFNDEMDYAAPKFKEIGAGVDTWDGDDMDVHNDQSKLYQKQKEKTGFNDSQVKAGNWASMIGQGEGTDTMSPNDFLDDEGKQFLQDAAKEAGFPPIENWDEPTEQDKDTLYRLSFPEDNGDKPTKINDIQVAFNDIRDENLIEKNKELTAQGKIPITIAGESHVELVDKMTRKGKEAPKEKLPEPEKPSEKDGGVVYSLGGGYYSDKPNGPAQYMASESVVEKVLVEGDNKFSYLLFETAVTKTTSKGKTVKLVTIEPKDQNKATAAAAGATSQSTDKNTTSEPKKVTSVPNITNNIKKKIENWSESEKDYFKKGHYKAGSEARRTMSQLLKDKAKGTWQAVKDGFKHEVEEFKTAGVAVGKLFSEAGGWNDLSHHEKDAIKAVGVKIVTTALFGAAMGGLSYGTAGFAKHVAIEFVPHVVAETFLKGAGRAALFADAEGEAEMDAQFIKFTEMIADGLENMKISPEQMEQMIDSYNKKKEENSMKNEISVINKIILEILNEAKKPGESKEHPGYYHRGHGYYSTQPDGEITHKTKDGKLKPLTAKEKAEKNAGSPQTKVGRKLGAGDFRQTTKSQPAVEKEPEEVDFSTMTAAQLKKYVEERIQQNAKDFENAENKDEFAIDFILKRQEEINNNFLRPAGSPASSLGENNGSKYINLIYSKGGKLTPEEEKNILNEIVSSELAQQIPEKDRLRWAKIALATAKTEARVLMYQKKYRAKQPQSQPYPMGVIMDKQSKAMLKNMLEEKLKNAKTPKQKQHYQKQLNYLDKLSESDTGVLYEMENGEIGFKHTSNKSSYKDPHNNTSVDEKIKAITASMGGKIDKGLVKAMQDTSEMVAAASEGIEDAAKKFASSRSSMSGSDRNAQDNIIGKIVSAFPVRGGTKNYLDEIKDKKWFIKKAKELGISIPIKSEKDAVTVAIALAADTPPPTAALKVLIKISELLEKITPENIDKTAKAFNISKKELEFLISSASQLKDAAKTRRDVMGEAHTQLVGAIQKADKNQKPPSYPYDKNADNGPHQQAYVEDYLHRMHFSAYIMGERDGVSSQNIGGDNVEPEYYRKCLAELSGYTGELDSQKGRAGLVEHLKKRVRINPKDDSIAFVNGKSQKELGTEVYRTKGESKSVVSGLGVDMQNCLKQKANEK